MDRGVQSPILRADYAATAGSRAPIYSASGWQQWLNDNAMKVGLGVLVVGVLFGVARK